MTSVLVRWSSLLTVAFVCWALISPLAGVAAQPKSRVDDQVGLFSAKAAAEARDKLAAIHQKTKRELVVQTVNKPPAKYKDNAREKSSQWAEENFETLGVDGVYILICKNPGIVQVVVGNQTKNSGAFTRADRDALVKLLEAKLKEGKKTGNYDPALLEGVAFVQGHMKATAGPGAVGKAKNQNAPGAQAPGHGEDHGGSKGLLGGGILGYVCIALVVLAGVWLLFAIIRGLSGAGGGAGGAPGMGYGGGGGGFMSSMLGGLFGAAAGMWLYNNFFGGGTHSAFGGPSSAGLGGDAGSNEPLHDTTGTSGEGGDWGGDAGAGDAGGGDAGGGDWGGGDVGGGDVGGGDWGGGGGDWGGGGGDFGGGGGDW